MERTLRHGWCVSWWRPVVLAHRRQRPGPARLRDEPARIYMVTNGDDADIPGFDVTDEFLTSRVDPVFVVPFDLTWD